MAVGYRDDVMRKKNVKKKRKQKRILREGDGRGTGDIHRNKHTYIARHTKREKYCKGKREKNVQGVKPSFRGPYLALPIKGIECHGVFVQTQV